MKMQEPLIPTICPTLTSSARVFHAKVSQLLESGSDLQTIQEALSSLKLPELLKPNGLHFFLWKMSPVCCRMTQAGHLKPSSPRYGVEWCVHNSANFGVPQQRRRLYIVASLGGRGTGEIFPLPGGNAEDLKQLIPGPQGQRVYDPSGVACTQCAGSGGWGGKTGLYFIDMNSNPVITRHARCITARQDSGVSNHRGEHSAVLVTDEPRAIISPDREKVRQQGRRIKEPNEPMYTITAQDRHGIIHHGRIRKLMPIECWRLQGFTDEQFYKAAATGLSDGRLYKMAGNAVSVPVISAIGTKLKEINERYDIVQ